MKVLVIGKTGQLARSLADAAQRAPQLSLEVVGRLDVDLAEPGSAAACIARSRPDLVINAAAYTQVDQAEGERGLAFRINADAAGEIARGAAEVGAGVTQLSTDYVFGGRSQSPYVEDAPTDPINAYGESKLAGEEAVRSANPNHIIIRSSWLVSPYGHNFVKTMLRLADDRDEVNVVADQMGRPTVVADLADALIDVAGRWPSIEPGTYHLAGGGEPASWADLAERIMEVRRELVGEAPAVRRIATADYPTPARRPLYSVLDCGKAERQLGIALPDWKDAVSALVGDLLESNV